MAHLLLLPALFVNFAALKLSQPLAGEYCLLYPLGELRLRACAELLGPRFLERRSGPEHLELRDRTC